MLCSLALLLLLIAVQPTYTSLAQEAGGDTASTPTEATAEATPTEALPPLPVRGGRDSGPADEAQDNDIAPGGNPVSPPASSVPDAEPEAPTAPITIPLPSGPDLPRDEAFVASFDDGIGDAWLLDSWLLTNDGSGNGYLITTLANASARVNGRTFSTFDLGARLQIASDNTAAIQIDDAAGNRTRLLFAANGNSRLYYNGELLQAGQAPDAISGLDASNGIPWQTVNVEARGAAITVSINSSEQLTYFLPVPITNAQISFVSGASNAGSVGLDDVRIVRRPDTASLIPSIAEPVGAADTPLTRTGAREGVTPQVEGSAVEGTPLATTPDQLTAEQRAKLPQAILRLLSEGLDSSAADAPMLLTDDTGRYAVTIWTQTDLSEQVIALNGVVNEITPYYMDVMLPLQSFVPLAAYAQVSGFELPRIAASLPLSDVRDLLTGTASLDAPDAPPNSNNYTDAFDVIGVHDWHEAGIQGSGVRVGVIATGFNVAGVGTGNSDFGCIETFIPRTGSAGNNSTGLSVVEIICDIAPQSTVIPYQAQTYSELGVAINTARADNAQNNVDVIVIALDLGAAATNGDGEGVGGANNPYAAITNARNDGIVILAAAGDNEQMNDDLAGAVSHRYSAFEFSDSDTVALNIRTRPGNPVNLSWSANDWNNPTQRPNVTLTGTGGFSVSNPVSGDAGDQLDTTGCSATFGVFCELTLTLDGFRSGSGTTTVQVQVTGDSGLQRPGGHIATAGSLARPADSPDVIAVAAACANDRGNFPRNPSSSLGPVYGPNGVAPTATAPFNRDTLKPDVTSFDAVQTQAAGDSRFECDGTVNGAEGSGGFKGTAAAVAHVAGIASLLQSDNLSSVNPTMAALNAGSLDAVAAIEDYIQSRTTDLPLGGQADGFDREHGAGLSLLGSPFYDWSQTSSVYAAAADINVASCTTIDYVDQNNLDADRSAADYGSAIANAFTQIGEGIAQANPGGCVVVLPGEYPTPLYINGIAADVTLLGYDYVTNGKYPLTRLQTLAQYWIGNGDYNYPAAAAAGEESIRVPTNAGVAVENVTGFTMRGFTFIVGKVFDAGRVREPQGVVISNALDTTIGDSSLGGVQIEGRSYEGFVGDDADIGGNATPISVIDGSHGTRIENVSFNGNSTDNASRTTSVTVVASGTSNKRVVVIGNDIRANRNIDEQGAWGSLLYGFDSWLDVVNNAFVGNSSEVGVLGQTSTTNSPAELRILGNVFLNNTIDTFQFNNGPLISLFYVPQFYMLSNTIVENDIGGGVSGIVGRGNPAGDDGSLATASQRWEIHNNLIYNNNFDAGIVTDAQFGNSVACTDLSGNANTAMQHNWVYGNAADGGACEVALQTAANDNIISDNDNATDFDDPGKQVVGVVANTGGLNANEDIIYYALAETSNEVYGSGIDAGDAALGTGVVGVASLSDAASLDQPMAGASYDTTIIGTQRLNDLDFDPATQRFDNSNIPDGDGDQGLDIGAFEYRVFGIVDNDIEATFVEDSNANRFEYDLNENIQGVGDVSISIDPLAQEWVWGTQCGDEFSDANQGLLVVDGVVRYCAPEDFYTDPVADGQANDTPGWADRLTISYQALDETGAAGTGQLSWVITPQIDDALTAIIGDGSVPEDEFRQSGQPNTNVAVRLRPNVTFSDSTGNFAFSERDNPEFINDTTRQTEFPYSYALNDIEDPNNLIDDASVQISGDQLQFTSLDQDQRTGSARILYDVTDATNTTTTHIFTFSIESLAAEIAGLFDDSSLAFVYSDDTGESGTGAWRPERNTQAINKSLHTSNIPGDTASFRFNGTGFVLYMFSDFLGGLYEVSINGETATADWAPTGPGSQISQLEIGSFTCTTRAPTSGGFVSNLSFSPGSYTVTCDSGLKGLYSVEIVNQVGNPAFRQVIKVDAFSIIDDEASGAAGPFTPGIYDVDQPEVQAIFSGAPSQWRNASFFLYSNGIAYESIGNDPDEISFNFTGSKGFAIGTRLDRFAPTYQICVSEAGTSGQRTCQRYDNAPENFTPRTYNAYRTFYGFEPNKEYTVSIEDIDAAPNAPFVFDALTIFPPTDDPLTMPFASIENEEIEYILYRGGNPDSWELNTLFGPAASNGTLSRPVPFISQVGPFAAFEVPADATGFELKHLFSFADSRQVLVCVDRHLSMSSAAGEYGNCMQVDMVNGSARAINANNGNLTGPSVDLGRINGRMQFNEGDFTSLWGDLNRDGIIGGSSLTEDASRAHVVEIFSNTIRGFSVDKITVTGDAGAFRAGAYEEGIEGLQPFNASLTPVAKTQAPFSYVTNFQAFRDSGSGHLATSQNNSGVYFKIEGTGFAPILRLENGSGDIGICWQAYDNATAGNAPAISDVVNSGNCVEIDNAAPFPQYIAKRPILGLEAGAYAVVVQKLNGGRMIFDGFEVYDFDWQNELQQFELGSRYEGDYAERELENKFLYFGDNWLHISGGAAFNQSATNYDQTFTGVGQAVLFRVTNADAITLIRDVRGGLSPYLVCYARESAPEDKTCTRVENGTGFGFAQPVTIPLNNTGNTEPYVVSVASALSFPMIFDAVEPTSLTETLSVGKYDDSDTAIFYPDLGRWRRETNSFLYFGGGYYRSVEAGAIASFTFNGTGFGLGMITDVSAGEVEVCYAPGLNGADENDTCFTYLNETLAPNNTTTRTVVGLPKDTYSVRIRDVDDGNSEFGFFQLPGLGAIGLDFVEIYDVAPPATIMQSVDANEDYRINGNQALQLLPGDRWASIRDGRAFNFSERSYSAVVNEFGFENTVIAGPAGLLTLDLDSGDDGTDYQEATVILKTDAPSFAKSDQLLACVDNVDGEIDYNNSSRSYRLLNSDSCTLTDDLRQFSQVVFNKDNLPLLGQPTGIDGTDRIFSFRTLSGGFLRVDGYQVLYDTALTDGFYEESIGFGAGADDILRVSNANQWRTEDFVLYSGGRALRTASNGAELTFDFSGTGFSLVALYDRLSGRFDAEISDGSGFIGTFQIDLNSPAPRYQNAYTYAGLPFGDYTVKLTAANIPGGNGRNIVDGIRIYGELQALGSLYDDAQTDLSGQSLLTYGPSRTTWTAFQGGPAFTALNQTLHQSSQIGATVTFEVGERTPATGIIMIYRPGTLARNVEVCFRDVTDAESSFCETIDPGGDPSGRIRVTPNGMPAGNYNVAIVNRAFGQIQLDAVQVLEGDTLVEGIYDVNYLNDVVDVFSAGNWTINSFINEARGAAGSSFSFDMTGIGFSLLLTENVVSAQSYDICVTSEGSATPCDAYDETIERISAPAGASSVNVFGLHEASGDNANYTVEISNGGSNDLIVRGVHVLGTRPDDIFTSKEIVENDDPRIRYLPFGSLNETIDRSGRASGGSQHTGRQRGSSTYFEFSGPGGLQYVRETTSFYGSVEVCYGVIGTDTSASATCETVQNNTGFGFQVARAIPTNASCETAGCWVSISNREDNRLVAFDYTRRFDANDPLTTGDYEESFPSLNFTPGNAWSQNSVPQASGGFVQATNSNSATLDFLMNGSAFSVNFTRIFQSGTVQLCWLPYDGAVPSIAQVQNNGECQRFNNQNVFPIYNSPRTIAGLVPGNYRVVVNRVNGGEMAIDGISIYNDVWFAADAGDWINGSGLRALEGGRRYEPSFVNRATDNQFLFYGNWTSNTGVKAINQSGKNSDQTNQAGASVVFRTTDANALLLYRDAAKPFSDVLACAQPVSLNPLGAEADRQCQTLLSDGVGQSQPVSFQFGNEDTGEYIVSLTTLEQALFNMDSIELYDINTPLTVGTYEDSSPFLSLQGNWEPVYNFGLYTNGRMIQSTSNDASASFNFTGTGFEVGLIASNAGGEVEMCYGPEASFDTDRQCFVYQQEVAGIRNETSRIVAGLPQDTYRVTLTDVEDGNTVLIFGGANFARAPFFAVGKLMIDYVRIFNDARPPALPAGYYNQDATAPSGQPYLQTLPDEKWNQVTGGPAFNFSEQSYLIPVNRFNVARFIGPGPAAVLTVNVPANDDATLILHSGIASGANTDQLLICAGDEMAGEVEWTGTRFRLVDSQNTCILTSALRSAEQVSVNSSDLAALGQAGEQRVMITSLGTGFVYIDAYQLILGDTLAPGLYDEALPDSLLDFSINGSGQINRAAFGCNSATSWCTQKFFFSIGDGFAFTRNPNASLTFDFDGTGFSTISNVDFAGVDFQICYKRADNPTPFSAGDPSLPPAERDLTLNNANGIWCDLRTTNQATFTASDWNEINANLPDVFGAGRRYGFSYYGLARDVYSVEIRVSDASIAPFHRLQIDAIAVFGESDTLEVMQPGFYDNAEAPISFEPTVQWTNRREFVGPPFGPYNLTEHTTTYGGTIAQMRIAGNAVTLYHGVNFNNSRQVNICMLITGETPHCVRSSETTTPPAGSPVGNTHEMTEFSQNGPFANFVPVMLYGLGEGEHTIIMENAAHNQEFNLDAIRVHE